MKKLFFSLAIILVSALVGLSQVTVKPAIGLSLNSYSNDGNGNAKAKVGANIGAGVAFGKKFYVEPGVYYTSKSTEFSFTESMETPNLDATIQGIRVPVAVGVGVLGNEKSLITLRAFGGGSGFFVTGTGKDLDKDEVESPTWGVFAGAGLDFWIMFVEASYEWSLNNSLKNIEVGNSRTMFFTVGLKF
jgi:hypothetical protein